MKTTVDNILNVFQNYRMAPTPLDQYEQVGKAKLADRLSTFVNSSRPIDFVMLGFPFKSTNIRDKVIGTKPDLGEQLTLDNFTKFHRHIQEVYSPGVQIHVVSDGFVFNDLLGVDDRIVDEYKEISLDMGRNSPTKIYDLNDFYSSGTLSTKREKVMTQFGITNEKLEHEILMNPDVNYLYRGMIMFMEQELAIKNFPSRNQLQKAAKILTRNMMFRNEAYSNLVREEFSSYIRLSMHPSVNNGAKYSFQLIPGNKSTKSAWHCAIVNYSDGTVATMHRKDAESAGYELVYKDGRPFNYMAD